jgi:hypothetical protein
MKIYINIFLTFSIYLLCLKSQGQLTVATNATTPQYSYEYIYNWDGTDITLFGYNPYFVLLDENPRVGESGDAFTSASSNDSFGYRITAVSDWDSDTAEDALNNGGFMGYLGNLTQALVDKHADYYGGAHPLKLGIGVENNMSTGANRRDRVGIIGEALILTFDTSGQIAADNTTNTRGFVPEIGSFTNTGLSTNTALRVSDIHLEPSNIPNNNKFRSLDYFIYDASENAILSDNLSDSGMELGFTTLDTDGTVTRSWTLDDGDMIILAYRNPPEAMEKTQQRLTQYSWGLWSLKMDLIDKSVASSDLPRIKTPVTIYPNPVVDVVTIDLDKTYKYISIKLFNTLGKELMSLNETSKNKISIDIENLKSGAYFLMVILDDHKSMLKLIKK